MKAKNKKILFRIFFLIILPLLIANLYLFPFYEKIELETTPNNNLSSSLYLDSKKIFEPSLKNDIRNLFQVPFDLNWYKICFYNGDHNIQGLDPNIQLEINHFVSINNRTTLEIPYNQKECILYHSDDKVNISLKWTIEFPSVKIEDFINGKISFEFDTIQPIPHIYARPLYNQLFIKQVLFMIAWISLFLLLFSAKRYILKGKL